MKNEKKIFVYVAGIVAAMLTFIINELLKTKTDLATISSSFIATFLLGCATLLIALLVCYLTSLGMGGNNE